jgi:HK97 family phage prohead protease
VIGSIDPAATREVEQGLYVEGKLDLQDSEVAREAWRSMENDAVSLSFGYVALKTRNRGGVNDLLELDLFEVSIVPHPANPDTRVLSMRRR